MHIWDSIRKNNNEEMIIKSIIWNTIIEFFSETLKIDIKKYLKSVQIKWKTILIKTNKPIINTEGYNNNDKIKKALESKFKALWIKFYDFEIKYI